MFVDSAVITVHAGSGGSGHVSFRREKFEPKGGPSGGDGGRGGDVILRAEPGLNTLLDFKGRPDWEAPNGESGGKKQQTGGDGQHLVIRVPEGTLVYDNDSGELLCDIGPDQEFIVARGGYGGFGNEHYKSPTNQAPTYSHPGQAGETKTIRLELKLLADVGFVGMPNAGKSTLLAALTRATPKIANYPFTTLTPQLGVAELDAKRRLVLADIPGLIEGASGGKGLGHDFLRHIERTKVLIHLLDCMPDSGIPNANYKTIRKELYAYSPVLAERDEVIVLSKLDLLPDDAARAEAVKKLRADLKLGRDEQVVGISSASNYNLRPLLEILWAMVSQARAADAIKAAKVAKDLEQASNTPAKKPLAKPAAKPAAKSAAKSAAKAPGKRAVGPAPKSDKPAAKSAAKSNPKPKSRSNVKAKPKAAARKPASSKSTSKSTRKATKAKPSRAQQTPARSKKRTAR